MVSVKIICRIVFKEIRADNKERKEYKKTNIVDESNILFFSVRI